MKHLSIKISGKVQGVFFRASAREKANEVGVKGFARNEPDRSVYIEAEGNDEALELFVAWCYEGPRLARVDSVDVKEDLWIGFSDFSINR